MSIEEQGILHTQIKAERNRLGEPDGMQTALKWNIAYHGERIAVYLLAMGVIGVMVLWATSSSPLLLYGSLALVILLTLLWGVARIRRIELTRQQRARQARAVESARSAARDTEPRA